MGYSADRARQRKDTTLTFAPENSAKILRSGRTTTVVRPGFRRPLPHALSARSRTHFGGGSCCTFAPVIVTGAQVKGHRLAIKRWALAFLSFWFGWGGVVPPMEGARLPLHVAHLFRLRKLPSVLAVCACTPTRIKHPAPHPVVPRIEGIHMDPLHKLLKKDEDREAVVRALGAAHSTLDEAIAAYRIAFKAATSIGWPKADLTKAGFPDPIRLPKASTRTPDAEA